MSDTPIGKVTHYYDKIGVAIVKVVTPLKIGDVVKFVKGDALFNHTISSMQQNHQPIEQADKGDEVGIKVDSKVSDGTLIFPA